MERAIIRALRTHRTFLVTMHVNPDPDALGAALAMVLFLRSLGKKVRLINDGPCPSWLEFMPASRSCEAFDAKIRFTPDVLIVLDCGDLRRIGRVAKFIKPGVKIINIDHHITNERFGALNLVDTASSSTSEMLYGLLKKARYVLTREMAALLYLGILTDTGSFAFDSTTPHTHLATAELLRSGLSVSALYSKVYETLPGKDLKPFLALMNTLTLHDDGRVACLTICGKQAKAFADDFDLKDKVFGFLRAVRGLEVIVILSEQDKHKTRLNFRSRGHVDVARLASAFNGGGHKKASGGYLDAPLARAKKVVLARLAKEI